ncbi:MAG: pseudouridine synthase [Cyanobacteriota bacterium]|nr:pseudouridine synthase [Cyanobacteriota bacterium]
MRYLLFYKPYGVLCQFSDKDNETNAARPTLKSYIPVPSVYPAGRLDRDSEGLLLLTDDGRLQHRLCEPRYGHLRTYWVQVEGIPDERAIAPLRSGIQIQNYTTRPARATRLDVEPPLPPRTPPIRQRKNIPTSWLELTLCEGKNRQVRRMTAAIGYPTLRLVRVAIASQKHSPKTPPRFATNSYPLLSLDGLQLGQWRDLSAAERQSLQRHLF